METKEIDIRYKSSANIYKFSRVLVDITEDKKKATISAFYVDGTDAIIEINSDCKQSRAIIDSLEKLEGKKNKASQFSRLMKKILKLIDEKKEKNLYTNVFNVSEKEITFLSLLIKQYYETNVIDKLNNPLQITNVGTNVIIESPVDYFEVVYDVEDRILDNRRKKNIFSDEMYQLLTQVNAEKKVGILKIQWSKCNPLSDTIIDSFINLNK